MSSHIDYHDSLPIKSSWTPKIPMDVRSNPVISQPGPSRPKLAPPSSNTDLLIPGSQEFLRPLSVPSCPDLLSQEWEISEYNPNKTLNSHLAREDAAYKVLGLNLSQLPNLFVSSQGPPVSALPFYEDAFDLDLHASLIASLLEDVESRGLSTQDVENVPVEAYVDNLSTPTTNYDSECPGGPPFGTPPCCKSTTSFIHGFDMNDAEFTEFNSLLDNYHSPSSTNFRKRQQQPNGAYPSVWQSPYYRKSNDHGKQVSPVARSLLDNSHSANEVEMNSTSDLYERKRLFDFLKTQHRSKGSNRVVRYTKPGEVTYISSTCAASISPTLRPSESLAPLHIVLPINLPRGKIIIAQSSLQTCSPREFPSHHYYFPKKYQSANQLFSRLHGLCNQNPSWLALDVGYVACREHQVAHVVDLFNSFFCHQFHKLAMRRSKERQHDAEAATSTHMEPIRLTCRGLRLREDHGSGWFLYETPVEPCSEQDCINFKEVVKLIEMFNECVRDFKLCQNATMKPFTNKQFAIVVLKQEGSGIADTKIEHANIFKCEGVELSEIRLVRHKLQDRYGNAMFEKDPRFGSSGVYGRPIAHNKIGRLGRFVFAKAALAEVVTRPAHQIHPVMSEFEAE